MQQVLAFFEEFNLKNLWQIWKIWHFNARQCQIKISRERWDEAYYVQLLRGFQYEEWKKFICLSYFDPVLRVKQNVVCPSVCLKRQYEEWNET